MSKELQDNDYTWFTEQGCREAEVALQSLATFRAYFKRPGFHCIMEVDLEYPAKLHDRDDDYPLAPENMSSTEQITGPKQHELRAKYFGAANPSSRKLICSFLPKRNYVVLGTLLMWYIYRGMRVVRVHRAIK